jgi:CBS domain containing-hemolysin-like protein
MGRIVGELWTDSDRPSPRIAVNPDGSTDVDGLTLVADVNERFGLQIDEEEYTTIGGYMLGRLGRRPSLGESVELRGRTLTVEALDGLRVARVRISRERQDEREPDASR